MGFHNVGDKVELTHAIMVGSVVYAKGTVAEVTAYGMGDNHEIRLGEGSNTRLITVAGPEIRKVLPDTEPEPQDEPKRGYAQAAEDHLVDVLNTHATTPDGRPVTSTTKMHSIMVADTYANLEIARQLGRIADALMELI
jgi:hypothetical protein